MNQATRADAASRWLRGCCYGLSQGGQPSLRDDGALDVALEVRAVDPPHFISTVFTNADAMLEHEVGQRFAVDQDDPSDVEVAEHVVRDAPDVVGDSSDCPPSKSIHRRKRFLGWPTRPPRPGAPLSTFNDPNNQAPASPDTVIATSHL